MSLVPGLFIDVGTPVPPPNLVPQILWPTYPGYGDNGEPDSTKFPQLTAIKARRSSIPPKALTAFIDAARKAKDRILVLDDFLFKPLEGQSLQDRCDQVLSWLDEDIVANKIQFLTNSHEDAVEQAWIQKQFDILAAAINELKPRRSGKITVEIQFTLGSRFPYVHDRFAIIDDELWHFGATVGGLHPLVNAATRGWGAVTHDAVRFFQDAWKGDDDADRSRGRRG